MNTNIYLIRHGQSPKNEGNERTRGLTDTGIADADRTARLLREEGIKVFYSSPYQRAMLTVEPLAQLCGQQIIPLEALKETVFLGGDAILPDEEVYPTVERMFREPDYALAGGESLAVAKERVMAALQGILEAHAGQRIAIGTHGMVMALMMGHYDSRYDYHFLRKTSKPDVYRMTFHGDQFTEAARLWIP
ncbi:MAG: histidine phosphatase family protein [Paenibacillaceae bacterium]|nr:histidine phosphatase family protein [Paenibacillaceae bacterium]